MNKNLRLFLLAGVCTLGIASCSSSEPKTSTPAPAPTPTPTPVPTPTPTPKPTIKFASPTVSASFGKDVKATLEGFQGTLTQEGKVEGFQVTIAGNVITIHPEKYLPGEHSFTFKGNGETYTLQVNLAPIPEPQVNLGSPFGIYTLDGTQLLAPKQPTYSPIPNRITLRLSANKSDPRNNSFTITGITYPSPLAVGAEVTGTLTIAGDIAKEVDGTTYLKAVSKEPIKASILALPTEEKKFIRLMTTLADGTTFQFVYALPPQH